MGRLKLLLLSGVFIFSLCAHAGADYFQTKPYDQGDGQPCQAIDTEEYNRVERIYDSIVKDKECLVTERKMGNNYPQGESRGSAGPNFKENLEHFEGETTKNINWAERQNKSCADQIDTYKWLRNKLAQRQQEPNLCPNEPQTISSYLQVMDGNLNSLMKAYKEREAYIAENERLRGVAQTDLASIDSDNGNYPPVAGGTAVSVPLDAINSQQDYDAAMKKLYHNGETTVKESY